MIVNKIIQFDENVNQCTRKLVNRREFQPRIAAYARLMRWLLDIRIQIIIIQDAVGDKNITYPDDSAMLNQRKNCS